MRTFSARLITGESVSNAQLKSVIKTSKTGLQRPAARYDGIGKIGGGYGFLVSMVSRVVSRCPWLPSWGPW